MAQPRLVRAAGAVVTRKGGDVVLVHRPRYDDWSFPKGKLVRGEHVTAAAVREVGEETGLHVRLGPPLSPQQYDVKVGPKTVSYWVARVLTHDDVGSYQVNREIDDVRWVSVERARTMLTYAHDRDTLEEAQARRRNTQALVVLRHSKARSRKAWRGDDRLRPLLQVGRVQAGRTAPLLAAYDVTEIATSSSLRCVQTVAPYGELSGWPTITLDGLSEEEATHDTVIDAVDELVHHHHGSAVLCTHRPVLPAVFDALGLEEVRLEPGGMVVVHHRRGRVVATETHAIP